MQIGGANANLDIFLTLFAGAGGFLSYWCGIIAGTSPIGPEPADGIYAFADREPLDIRLSMGSTWSRPLLQPAAEFLSVNMAPWLFKLAMTEVLLKYIGIKVEPPNLYCLRRCWCHFRRLQRAHCGRSVCKRWSEFPSARLRHVAVTSIVAYGESGFLQYRTHVLCTRYAH